MKPNTAFGLLFAAIALWLARTPSHRRRHSFSIALLATTIIVIAALTAIEYFLQLNLGIDELLFADFDDRGRSFPHGRPAPGTALALLAIATAVLAIDRFPRISQALVSLAAVVGLVGLIGYVNFLPSVYTASHFTSLAINTVIALLALCLGLYACRPDRGMTGMLMNLHHRSQLRILLAGAVGLPILLGFLTQSGVRLGFYGIEFSFALFSVLLIVLTVILVWTTGRQQETVEQQRQSSEAALLDSEQSFRAMADNIPNLAWMAHADGHIFWYNTRWYQYTGVSFEELEGWGWERVHDPGFINEVLSRWRKALERSESFEMEFPLRGSDGVFRWFLTRVSPVLNDEGVVSRWFGTNTNIDDKKKAEEALRRSEELARAVIEGTPASVELLDEGGRTLLINQQGRTIRERLQKPDATWLESWNDNDSVKAAEAFATAVDGTLNIFTITLNGASSEPTWLEVTLTPITRAEGAPRRVLSVTRDITSIRKAEEKLNQTAKLESLGVMAGGIAHDFNNLLTGILGNASLLEMSANPEDAAIARQIVASSQRAADLTRQMLAYSGKGRFVLNKINLSTTVEEILQMVKTTIDKKVEIVLDLAPSLPAVEADPGQMQQLIMNLIINASDSMEGKVGKVSISTSVVDVDEAFIAQTFRVDESSLVLGRYVRLEVQDTGCGMSAETISKIFDPFFTTKFAGRGLGLAAVSGILRGHRGALRIYSQIGHGSTFKVFLPVAESSRPASTLDASKAIPVLGQGQGAVLFVDDEEVIRRVGQLALQKAGYEVLLAENGSEAVQRFLENQERIQVIILDMTMPVIGGEEALSRLRDVNPMVPVILCSGYNQVEAIRHFTKQKITSFVQKPYTTRQLLGAIAEIILQNHGELRAK